MSGPDQIPQFSLEDAVRLALEHYGIVVTATVLPSYQDQNFLLESQSGERYVLKIANGMTAREMIEAEQMAMSLASGEMVVCPRVIPASGGGSIIEIESRSGKRHRLWMISWLPGVPMGRVRRHSAGLMRDLGRTLGRLDRALAGFDHPAIHRDLDWDLAGGKRIIQQYHSHIESREMRDLVSRLVVDFEEDTEPLLGDLRRSAIHNDANDYNILVGITDLSTGDQRVTGVVDFGDLVHSYTVSEPAIAIAYAILGKPDPLATASEIIAGYHSEYELAENEIAALFGLVRLRLCTSISMAAYKHSQSPGSGYLTISQSPIRDMLPQLANIPAHLAEAAFRQACGLPPVKSSGRVVKWLSENSKEFAPVLGMDLGSEPSLVFDLGIDSPLISGDEKLNAEPALTQRIFGLMKKENVRLGIGQYDEPRLLYTTPAFTAGGNPFDEHRTIHLGIDLFAVPGTPVFAPLAGTVHSFNNNHAPLDYGPVIILRHETGDGTEFFSLYGHLSEDSLDGLSTGKKIARGERIASIGAPPVNGNWTPHLHFQIIIDLMGLDCDFPGVGRAGQRDIWRGFSPDPNLILGIPEERFPPRKPEKSETLAARRRRIGSNLSIAYRDPLKIVRGWKQYLFDENGRRYLDAYNNVPHIGHCHPRVVEVAARQMSVLNTNTRYLGDLINEYAERICATLPPPLSVCYFVNSASEANELALRLARAHTRRRDMIVLEAAYHGHTTSLIDISPYKHDGPGGSGAPAWVHTAPIPDLYRGEYKRGDHRAGLKYAGHVRQILEGLRERGMGPAGFIAETCPSVGGQIFFPPGYLPEVYKFVRSAGGICIADEVQTAYGRTGKHFWAFEEHDVVPDIVVMGKPIGNGHPIGAVVTTPEIAGSFDNGMEFFSTFGGNNVSCAIGLAVLDVLFEENLQQHALKVGNRMLEVLRQMVDRFELIGDVRGSGFFLGIELVRDRRTLEPAAEEASAIVNRMREHGILLGTDGPHHNVIKIRPPMPFSESDADYLVSTLDGIFADYVSSGDPSHR